MSSSKTSGRQRGYLPYGRHLIEQDDIEAVAAVMRGTRLTTGPTVEAFEEAFRTYVGAQHAVVCANRTAALHLAALALDIRPEDVAIVPSVTFHSGGGHILQGCFLVSAAQRAGGNGSA
jgi:dTDP-4-amino-4,6-dideoxygalactose transaminase